MSIIAARYYNLMLNLRTSQFNSVIYCLIYINILFIHITPFITLVKIERIRWINLWHLGDSFRTLY